MLIFARTPVFIPYSSLRTPFNLNERRVLIIVTYTRYVIPLRYRVDAGLMLGGCEVDVRWM